MMKLAHYMCIVHPSGAFEVSTTRIHVYMYYMSHVFWYACVGLFFELHNWKQRTRLNS